MIGTSELIIIAIVIFVLFGASSIPKFAKSIGQAKAAFQDGVKEGQKNNSEPKKRRVAQKTKSRKKKTAA